MGPTAGLIYNDFGSIMKNLQEQVKKHSVTKNCSDLSLFEQIVLVISKFLQILGLQPRISKFFSITRTFFFLTVGQNNFGNKIPFFVLIKKYYLAYSHSSKICNMTRFCT